MAKQTLWTRAWRGVSEIIGLPRPVITRWFGKIRGTWREQSYDFGTTDYAFWDRARLGRVPGLELSGAFLKPISSKFKSYVLGRQPAFRINNNPYAEKKLNEWVSKHYALVQSAYEDARGLGDMYLVVNPDLTLVAVSPDVVYPLVDPQNYSRIIGWAIDQSYPHPTEQGKYTRIVDEYTATHRHRWVMTDGKVIEDKTYPNLIGRVPVIHISANRKANELFGRPDGEPILPILNEYNEVMYHGITGNKRQGRPTPAMEKLGSENEIKRLMAKYGRSRSHTDPDTGQTYQTTEVAFDADQLVMLAGSGEFSYKSPSPFIGETEKMLGLLFYIIVQHTEIPEYAYGTAIASSKASAESQSDPFTRLIECLQNNEESWLIPLVETALTYMGLSDRRVRSSEEPICEWRPVNDKDGDLTLRSAVAARKEGAMDRETFLKTLPIEIKNPEAVIAAADAEYEEMQTRFEKAADDALDAPADGEDEETPDDESVDDLSMDEMKKLFALVG